MTFKRFQEVVKKHYPQAVVYHHGEIACNRNKLAVSIEFTPGGRVYQYSGSYEAVLNKLKINAISQERAEQIKKRLQQLIAEHGKIDEFWFDDEDAPIIDNSKEIEYLQNILATAVIA